LLVGGGGRGGEIRSGRTARPAAGVLSASSAFNRGGGLDMRDLIHHLGDEYYRQGRSLANPRPNSRLFLPRRILWGVAATKRSAVQRASPDREGPDHENLVGGAAGAGVRIALFIKTEAASRPRVTSPQVGESGLSPFHSFFFSSSGSKTGAVFNYPGAGGTRLGWRCGGPRRGCCQGPAPDSASTRAGRREPLPPPWRTSGEPAAPRTGSS
jgi:hypothetical protein